MSVKDFMVFKHKTTMTKKRGKKKIELETNEAKQHESKQHESNQIERIHQIITYKHKRQW